mmetsp:Transcript_1649/g.4963  ORF Transcript_1649/g.4963 Transcript_1649/m.4963 type:complete len:151 (-) Transcript_1649:602-1054(-)
MNAPQIVLVESSALCEKDSQQQKVLPDGSAWLPEAYRVFEEVLSETMDAEDDQTDGANAKGRPDELEPAVDERLQQWRDTEEMLFMQLDTWYMEDTTFKGIIDGKFVKCGYQLPPLREYDEGYVPLFAALLLYISVYLTTGLVDHLRQQR